MTKWEIFGLNALLGGFALAFCAALGGDVGFILGVVIGQLGAILFYVKD